MSKDQEVHLLLSWTTRKNYPTLIGISLPIQDPVGGDLHEVQLWEEAVEDLMFEMKSIDPVDQLAICVNGSEEMKRNE
jgi:hypothetical protein